MIFDENLAKTIYNLGSSLIQDDKGDIGWITYRNRNNHVYHGKVAPNHPSPFHHWQIGTILCMLGQAMALGAMAQDVYDTPVDDTTAQSEQL
jgi:hypothetical protein